ncbi:hypothetical protein BV25DRAFT_1903115 [Artomyces pyxidatus]|uniref:Uncharacterized protein n=1 Tax=Artomyces pyxidatus TaxID=48021 RepID=A0ACB8SLN2_9AGAM|nr:hypothetical protein BV25DRAFT_1903115 [Artomyces pyxidatus]
MHPSIRAAHKPLISFLGKRKWPANPEPQHPHPAAPAQLRDAFSDFLKKFESSGKQGSGAGSKASSGKAAYGEFWEAPERLWRNKASFVEDAEIDAVLSGGASLR